MSCSWSSHGASVSMSTSKLSLAEMMDIGFVADLSSYVHSTPFQSYYVEGRSALEKRDSSYGASLHMSSANPTLMENSLVAETSDVNSSLFHSLCVERNSALKVFVVSESSKLIGDEVQRGFNASDILASMCKTPIPLNSQVFDLSSLVTENNSRFNKSVVDLFCDNKISTPCKEEKPAPLENQPSKSPETSEVLVDLLELQKPTPLIWEISEINLPLDNTLSLDTSIEEWRSPSSIMVERDTTLPLERSSLASAMSFHWTGARPQKTSSLAFKSFAYETQLNKSKSVMSSTSSQHIKPFDFAIPSPDDRWHDKHPAPYKSQKVVQH